jgi:hypothetical protein
MNAISSGMSGISSPTGEVSGSGAATAASTATGAIVDNLLAAISSTGTATENFNNAGAAAFATDRKYFCWG